MRPTAAATRRPPHGLVYSCSRRHDLLPTNNPRSSRFLAGAPWRHAGGAYSDRSLRTGATFPGCFYLYLSAAGVPNLGKLAKISLCCLILQKNGRLVPPPKADKRMPACKFILLSLGLLAGYMASKDHSKLAFMLKVCDGSMKIYKVFAEIVDILSAFFK